MYDMQARKWHIVINNPQDAGLDRAAIEVTLRFLALVYYCFVCEIAATGTRHIHIFLYSASPIRFSTLKKKFPGAHIERARGSVLENRDYIRKDGKWAETDKAETTVPGTFVEWGEIPPESTAKDPEQIQIMQEMRDGKTIMEIVEKHPKYALRIREVEILRQTVLNDLYQTERRHIAVTYIWGATGTGKTRSIYERHNAKDICRITNYGGQHGVRFDAYHGEDVLVFEEFRGQVPIADMLNYLDIYPLMLPARYSDRVACYTKVYLTSNIPLEEQYRAIQRDQMETWHAFLRRIHTVIEYQSGQPPKVVIRRDP